MNICIPLIKNVMPNTLANDICSVQPMAEHDSGLFKLSITTKPDNKTHGAIRHGFIEGWQRNYHGEWISAELWLQIKIAGL